MMVGVSSCRFMLSENTLSSDKFNTLRIQLLYCLFFTNLVIGIAIFTFDSSASKLNKGTILLVSLTYSSLFSTNVSFPFSAVCSFPFLAEVCCFCEG